MRSCFEQRAVFTRSREYPSTEVDFSFLGGGGKEEMNLRVQDLENMQPDYHLEQVELHERR